MHKGSEPTVIVAVTEFVAVDITLIVLSVKFATYTLFPSGLTDIPQGLVPTGIVAETVFVATLITETVLSPSFVI